MNCNKLIWIRKIARIINQHDDISLNDYVFYEKLAWCVELLFDLSKLVKWQNLYILNLTRFIYFTAGTIFITFERIIMEQTHKNDSQLKLIVNYKVINFSFLRANDKLFQNISISILEKKKRIYDN